jgi:hypothetical protein
MQYYSKAGNIEIGLGDASAEGDQQALQDPPPHPNRFGTVPHWYGTSTQGLCCPSTGNISKNISKPVDVKMNDTLTADKIYL